MSKLLKADRRKNNIAKVFLAFLATIMIIVMVYLLFVKGSNAFLADRGQWADNTYSLGRIDYIYNINNQEIEVDKAGTQVLTATVPIIGGVKINDTAIGNATLPNYERFAEENFNEGITVAHIVINNKSDFSIYGKYEMVFNDMFEQNKNIFYLILPNGTVVDTAAKTVDGTSYKNYVKTAMANKHSSYDEMISSMKDYYANNVNLKSDSFVMTTSGDTSSLEYDILFWSEYDQLPFVTNGELDKVANPNSSIEGTFSFSLNISQEASIN